MANEWLPKPTHCGIWEMGLIGKAPLRVNVCVDTHGEFVYEYFDERGFGFHFPTSDRWRYRFTGEEDWPVVPED